MNVVLEPDAKRLRVVAVVVPGIRWAKFHECIRAALVSNPHWGSWDWIIHDHGPMDDVDVSSMSETGALFCSLSPQPGRQTYTVVVTRDRYFAQWALVINRHYGGRIHVAAPTLDGAHIALNSFAAAADARTSQGAG